MKISGTLSRYLARSYFVNMVLLLVVLSLIIYLFDTVELIRRAGKHDDVPLSVVFRMGMFKLPEVTQVLLPFAVLFSAIYTFRQLTKRYELIVVRASGVSWWQFLMPVLMVSILAGFVYVGAINPLGSALLTKFEAMERKYLTRQENEIALLEGGLWLRQETEEGGYAILHAPVIRPPTWALENVTLNYFDKDDRFLGRVDALDGALEEGAWVFKDAVIYTADRQRNISDLHKLPTALTIKDIEESFSSPKTLSVWHMPRHIRTLEKTGLDASRLKVHFYNLLIQPLMFAAMIFIAACVSMRPPRFQGTVQLMILGIFLGFAVFFLSSYLQALGASGQIPPLMAAWSPAFICLLFGLGVMMGMEDG